MYQKVSEKVSPYVAPTIEKISTSKYYNAVVDHLKPVEGETAAKAAVVEQA